MLADANNYDLQNVECQSQLRKSLVRSCEISTRSSRFARRASA